MTISCIILFAGIFGGVVNYFTVHTKREAGSNRKCWGTVLAGIAASCLVPLFLSMISSDLIVNSRKDDKYYFVFAGLCLVAAIFSRRFINSMSKRILEQVEKVNKTSGQQAVANKLINNFFREYMLNHQKEKENGNDDKE